MGLLEDAANAAKKGANAAGNAVNNAANAANSAANAAGKAASDAAKAAQEAAERAARDAAAKARAAADAARDNANRAGNSVREVVEKPLEAAVKAGGVAVGINVGAGFPKLDFLPRERQLTDAERKLAQRVFRDTLPYGAIYLSNQTGLGGAPYTIPHPLRAGSYVIHIGAAFADAAADGNSVTFIHELAHVWQGVHHGKTPLDYVCNSLVSQAGALLATGNRNGAYAYTPGASWNSYNVEQQASIVEDWFNPRVGNMSTSDSRFRYIRDNIRTAQKRWVDEVLDRLPLPR